MRLSRHSAGRGTWTGWFELDSVMDVGRLQDKIAKGMGVAARKIGGSSVVYRPHGVQCPIGERNRIIKLLAAFEPEGGSSRAIVQAMWRGTFDSLYTRPGDYLVGSEQTFFIGNQMANLPLICILTNGVVRLQRPSFAIQGGYSGLHESATTDIAVGWPASLLESGGQPDAATTAKGRFGEWTLLLPRLPISPQVADVVSDEAGATYVVGAAEQSVLGWRMLVRQIAV